MPGWMSKLGVVVVAWGMLEGCGAPVDEEDTQAPADEPTSERQELTESLASRCLPNEAGTQRMKSNLPSAGGRELGMIPAPDSFVSFKGQLYFTAFVANPGQTLWRSDGTPEGTVAVKDFPGAYSLKLVPSASRLFLEAYDTTYGWVLGASDGTTAGTRLLSQSTPTAKTAPMVDMTVLGDRLVFFRQVRDADNLITLGAELWTSDGTTAGTVRQLAGLPVVTPPESSGGAAPYEVMKLGDKLLFITRDENGSALWKTDGTKAGTTRLKDIGDADKFVNSTLVSGGWAFFHVSGTDGKTAVWKSDGTKAGTQRLYTYDASLTPLMFRVLGSSLYAVTGSSGQRLTLRRIPLAGGSESPVVTLPNEYASQGFQSPRVTGVSAAEGGKKLYFTLAYFDQKQRPRDSQLWVTDGTAAGTLLLRQPLSRVDAYTTPIYAAADNLAFFTAGGRDTTGIEPYVTDGTPEGTRRIKDLVPGPSPSYPYNFLRVGARVFLSTADPVDGGQLWTTQLSTNNTCSTSVSP